MRPNPTPRSLLPLALLALSGCAAASGTDGAPDPSPAPPPGTDVWFATLAGDGTGLRASDFRNATARPGYDNQPAFTRDGSGLLYTAADAAGGTDIRRLELGPGGAVTGSAPLTRTTPESEYSPTPLPQGLPGAPAPGFSAIVVEPDSTQRLWRYDASGRPGAPVLRDVAPVGYHAWLGGDAVALFVLGDPPTLRLARPGPDGRGDAVTIATDIGRSLQRMPGGATASFVQRLPDGSTRVDRLDASGEVLPIVALPTGADDHAWTPDGTLLVSDGDRILGWRPDTGGAPADGWWTVARVPGGRAASRLAVAPDGRTLAVVLEESVPGPGGG